MAMLGIIWKWKSTAFFFFLLPLFALSDAVSPVFVTLTAHLQEGLSPKRPLSKGQPPGIPATDRNKKVSLHPAALCHYFLMGWW